MSADTFFTIIDILMMVSIFVGACCCVGFLFLVPLASDSRYPHVTPGRVAVGLIVSNLMISIGSTVSLTNSTLFGDGEAMSYISYDPSSLSSGTEKLLDKLGLKTSNMDHLVNVLYCSAIIFGIIAFIMALKGLMNVSNGKSSHTYGFYAAQLIGASVLININITFPWLVNTILFFYGFGGN